MDELRWCATCRHFRKIKDYPSKHRVWFDSPMHTVEFPCQIAGDIPDVWKRYINTPKEDRFLYPRDCNRWVKESWHRLLVRNVGLHTIEYAIFIVVAVFMLYSFLTSSSKHERAINAIRPIQNGVIMVLSDGLEYLVDFGSTQYNMRNVSLFYAGKIVWVTKDKDDQYRIAPIKQKSAKFIDADHYVSLVAQGFTDKDIEYSFSIPPQVRKTVRNPNAPPPNYGGVVSYGAPGVSAKRLSDYK